MADPVFRSAYDFLAPSPDANYGSVLPFAYNREGSGAWVQEGSNPRLAMPEWLRSAMQGVVGLGESTQTGQLTPEALALLTSGSVGTGSTLGVRGALASGGARPALAMDEASRMARAKAQGNTTDVYHATGKDFTQFDNSKSVRQAYGAATHVAADPALANMFARQLDEGGRVMPLKVNLGKVADADTFKQYAAKNDWDIPKTTQALINDGYESVSYSHGQFFTPQDGRLVGSLPGQDQAYAILNPANIRSRFARFDPEQAGSSNIMAARVGGVPVPGFSVAPPSQQQVQQPGFRVAKDMVF
jgi:hypothetical protein